MGTSVADFNGKLPVEFDLDSFHAECRSLSSTGLEYSAAPAVEAAERQLAKLHQRVNEKTISFGDETSPIELYQVDQEIRRAAAWLGLDHPRIESLVESRQKSLDRLEARKLEFFNDKRAAASPLTRPVSISYGYKLIEAKRVCSTTPAARHGLERLVPEVEHGILKSDCLNVLVLERAKKNGGSALGWKDLRLETLGAAGERVPVIARVVGDGEGWSRDRAVANGARVAVVVGFSRPEDEVVFLMDSKQTIRAVESDVTSLEPVALGATSLTGPAAPPR